MPENYIDENIGNTHDRLYNVEKTLDELYNYLKDHGVIKKVVESDLDRQLVE